MVASRYLPPQIFGLLNHRSFSTASTPIENFKCISRQVGGGCYGSDGSIERHHPARLSSPLSRYTQRTLIHKSRETLPRYTYIIIVSNDRVTTCAFWLQSLGLIRFNSEQKKKNKQRNKLTDVGILDEIYFSFQVLFLLLRSFYNINNIYKYYFILSQKEFNFCYVNLLYYIELLRRKRCFKYF